MFYNSNRILEERQKRSNLELSMEHLLTAQHISKNYGELNVLTDVSLSVDTNEIITIVGPSGAGKTTLLHILGTLDRPNKNSETKVTINETDTTQLSDKNLAQFRNQNMGFIFSKLWNRIAGATDELVKVVVIGLQNSGKTTILYKLSLGEIIVT